MPKPPKAVFFTLDNGIKIVHRKVNSTALIHCGFIADAGSRDEEPNEVGIAHFTEHMVFKGTRTRKVHQILNRLDSVGGDLNADTTKEKTGFYASCGKEHFVRAFDLLFDLVTNPIFPADELEKEKGVILDEIEMYNDSPEDMIMENFDSLIFPGHPLGNPILGSKETVSAFQSADFFRFHQKHYTSSNLVFSVVGNFNPKTLDRLIKTYLEPVPAQPQPPIISTPLPAFEPAEVIKKTSFQQANMVIGGPAYPYGHPDYFAFLTLNYLLGGPAMNSRLSYTLREKHGLTYNVFSFYNPLTDGGQWGIYVGCDEKYLSKVRKLIINELKKLCNETFTPVKLAAIKRQFIGYIALSYESLSGQMLSYAKDYADFNRLWLVDDVISEIKGLTADRLSAAGQDLMNPDRLTTLIFIPEE